MTSTRSIQGVAIVTGGGQGLGRAFSHGLAASGAQVVVADLVEDNAQRVAQEITDAGGSAIAVAVDVRDPASVSRMVDEATKRLGAPSILVNNAAIFSTLELKPMTEISLAEWRQVLDVNVTGVFLCCQAVVPPMSRQGYGKIINISSAAFWTGRPGYLHYVASKAGVIGLTRALASEVGENGIRVNAITPGSVRTEIERATISEAAREAMAQQTALRRVQVPEDVVGVVLFLASTESDFITGQTINVDGGYAFH